MRTLPTLVVALLVCSGCVPAVIGGGAYTVKSATSERGLGGTLSDLDIQTSINKRWWDHDADMNKRFDLTVTEGRVLITGQARDQEQKLAASRLTWEVPGVKEVINEAEVQGSTTIASFSKDLWITSKLRTLLTFDRDVAGRNYTIDTVKSVVYLMGSARSQDELNRVTNHASNIDGVQRVVSYVRMAGEPLPAGVFSGNSGSVAAEPAPASGTPIDVSPAIQATPID
jgi:osmotically-inducible protein OsmY